MKEDYKKALDSVANVLNGLGLKWWISAGTLLGAVRERDFLPKEHDDIDIGLRELPFRELTDSLKQAGFIIRFLVNCCNIGIGMNTSYKSVMVDFGRGGFYGDKLLWMSNNINGKMIVKMVPNRFFGKLGKVMLAGDAYPAPFEPEKVLELYYGKDWSIPKTNWNRFRDYAAIKAIWNTKRIWFMCPECRMPNDWYVIKTTDIHCLYCHRQICNYDMKERIISVQDRRDIPTLLFWGVGAFQ